jgi:hypothetical protein
MTKEEENAAIKAECARLGRPIPRTIADLRSLALALIAERQGEVAPPQSPKNPVGAPLKLTPFHTLLFSRYVSELKEKGGANETQACEIIFKEERRRKLFGSPNTLRTKISRLRSKRSKNIKDEKFKAKLLRQLDEAIICAEIFAGEDKEAADAIIRFYRDVVAEYLGEDTSEPQIRRINESVEKVSVRN